MSNNGGYYVVDLKGLDLTSDSTQTISGLFADMKKAIASGKPLIAINAVWGANSDAPLTPIHFFAQQWNANLVVGTASILNISCTNEDVVTVTNLTT